MGIKRYLECLIEGNTKIESSMNVARYHFGAGEYKAKCLRLWTNEFVKSGTLHKSQGKHRKVIPLIEDGDLRQKCLTFLRCQKVEQLNASVFVKQLQEVIFPEVFGFSATITEKTARNWLKDLGFEYTKITKGCYVDGHEREDVVAHRLQFLKRYGTI